MLMRRMIAGFLSSYRDALRSLVETAEEDAILGGQSLLDEEPDQPSRGEE